MKLLPAEAREILWFNKIIESELHRRCKMTSGSNVYVLSLPDMRPEI